ncbi:MAG: hypothetical protein HYV07_20860 [Deltaproteobacteria bacterium]|nr:hypothetical protein [Deltaproteobacteria bacterium]
MEERQARMEERQARMEERQARMEERQISTEKLLMELVAVNVRMEERQARMEERQARMERRQDVMEGHLSALAEIVRSGFDRVGRELEKVNARIDETNASLRLIKGAATGALEYDDSRIRALERRVDAIEEKIDKKSA